MITRRTNESGLAAAGVEDVIGVLVQLKKAGSHFTGLSPFSDAKSPSCMVSPCTQISKEFS